MMTRHTAYIGVGSNLGDRRAYLYEAVDRLHRHASVAVERCSSIYETAPVGLTEQPHFLNMAVAVSTALSPHELLELMLEMEQQLGRVRTVRYGPRTIDLDLLMYGNLTIDSERLALPHPRMNERGFVLIPLLDIIASGDGPPDAHQLRSALERAEGKEDIVLWQTTDWRCASGRFAN